MLEYIFIKRIDGVMACVIASSVVDREYEPDRFKRKTICCISTRKHAALKEGVNIVWLGIKIMCPREATCLPMACCLNEPKL